MDHEADPDPAVSRLWTIAQISKEFGLLPTEVAKDLDEDPAQTAVGCLVLLRYAEAKHAHDHAKTAKDLDHWAGSKIMESVQEITFELVEEEMKGE